MHRKRASDIQKESGESELKRLTDCLIELNQSVRSLKLVLEHVTDLQSDEILQFQADNEAQFDAEEISRLQPKKTVH